MATVPPSPDVNAPGASAPWKADRGTRAVLGLDTTTIMGFVAEVLFKLDDEAEAEEDDDEDADELDAGGKASCCRRRCCSWKKVSRSTTPGYNGS